MNVVVVSVEQNRRQKRSKNVQDYFAVKQNDEVHVRDYRMGCSLGASFEPGHWVRSCNTSCGTDLASTLR